MSHLDTVSGNPYRSPIGDAILARVARNDGPSIGTLAGELRLDVAVVVREVDTLERVGPKDQGLVRVVFDEYEISRVWPRQA